MRRTILASGLVSLLAGAAASAQTFDNRAVMALHAAGLGDEAIIAKVRSLPCNYDTSTDSLIALKRAGIGDEVIVAMVQRCTGASRAQGTMAGAADPMTAHAPGIYLQVTAVNGATLEQLRPVSGTALKTTGNGSILFPRMAKLIVPQPHAQLTAKAARPVFWFYFDTADRKVNSFGTLSTLAAQSPN